MQWTQIPLFESCILTITRHSTTHINSNINNIANNDMNATSVNATSVNMNDNIVEISCCLLYDGMIVIGMKSSGCIYTYPLHSYNTTLKSTMNMIHTLKYTQQYEVYTTSIQCLERLTSYPDYIVCLGNDSDNSSILTSTSLPTVAMNTSTLPSIVKKNVCKVIQIDKEIFKFMYAIPLDEYTSGHTIEIFTASGSGQQFALGLSDGSVVIVTIKNFHSDMPSEFITSGRLVLPPQSASVSNLHFCNVPIPTSITTTSTTPVTTSGQPLTSSHTITNETRLFITLDKEIPSNFNKKPILVSDDTLTVSIYNIDPSLLHKSKNIQYITLEESMNIPKKCASICTTTCELIVALSEALYVYSIEERGSAIGIQGNKNLIYCFSIYTLIITNNHTTITIYDLKARIIYFQQTYMNHYIIDVICSHNTHANSFQLCLLTNTNIIILINELSILLRINIFSKLNLFESCLLYLAQLQCSPDDLCIVYKKYGDYLYKKKLYEKAYQMYKYTIGSSIIQSSYIIQQFQSKNLELFLFDYLVLLAMYKCITSQQLDLLIASCCANMPTDTISNLIKTIKENHFYFQAILNSNALIHKLIECDLSTFALEIAQIYGQYDDIVIALLSCDSIDYKKVLQTMILYSENVSSTVFINFLDQFFIHLHQNASYMLSSMLLYLCGILPNNNTSISILPISSCLLTIDDCIAIYKKHDCSDESIIFFLQRIDVQFFTTTSILFFLELLMIQLSKCIKHPNSVEKKNELEANIGHLVENSLIFKNENICTCAFISANQLGLYTIQFKFTLNDNLCLELLYENDDVCGIYLFLQNGTHGLSKSICKKALRLAVEIVVKQVSSLSEDSIESNWDIIVRIISWLTDSEALFPVEILGVLSAYKDSIPNHIVSSVNSLM